jgi:hypothetical protein
VCSNAVGTFRRATTLSSEKFIEASGEVILRRSWEGQADVEGGQRAAGEAGAGNWFCTALVEGRRNGRLTDHQRTTREEMLGRSKVER